MLQTLEQVVRFYCGNRPHEKLVLMLLSLSEGAADRPFPIELRVLAEHSELSEGQVMAVINDLDRRSVIRLDGVANPMQVLLTL